MEVIEKTYLKSTSLQLLQNWSVQYLLESKFSYNKRFELTPIGLFLKRNKTPIDIEDDKDYKRVTIKIKNGGVFLRDFESGKNIGTKKQFIISKGQFLLSKIDARNGAFGVVPDEIDGAIITGNFWTFDVDYSMINPHFLALITTTPEFIKFSENASNGTTNRHYLQEDLFLAQKIPLPNLTEQNRIVEAYNEKIKLAEKLEQKAKELEDGIEVYLFKELGINNEIPIKKSKKGIRMIQYINILEWGLNKIGLFENIKSDKFVITNLELSTELFNNAFRGKSPKYSAKDDTIILNQKCNRWNKIKLEYSKTVDKEWLSKIDELFFTQIGDILINSTGEGTIGRASVINDGFQNLLYDSHLILLRLNKEKVNPYLFVILFNSKYGQRQVENIKSAQTTKQTELGVNNLKKIFFPLPHIELQNKIVEIIRDRKLEIKHLVKISQRNRDLAIKEFENEIFKPCD